MYLNNVLYRYEQGFQLVFLISVWNCSSRLSPNKKEPNILTNKTPRGKLVLVYFKKNKDTEYRNNAPIPPAIIKKKNLDIIFFNLHQSLVVGLVLGV